MNGRACCLVQFFLSAAVTELASCVLEAEPAHGFVAQIALSFTRP